MPIVIVSAILFLSGISALIFQTLWLRLSGLAFGNSVWSAALILSSFMAGLALGNAIAARAGRPLRRTFRLYALLEITLAVCGVAIVFALPAVGGALQPLYRAFASNDAVLNAVRFCFSFLILLIPTTAMGLTLPVLVQDESLLRLRFSGVVGMLYGWNTLGAVAGALAGELLLIERFGILGTAFVAGGLSIIAAGIAFLASLRPRASLTSGSEVLCTDGEPGISPACIKVASFICGAILLALEVVWFRFLRLYLLSSPQAFGIMLAVVLAGIGLGGLLSAVTARFSVVRYLPAIAIAAGLVTLLGYIFAPTAMIPGLQPGYYIEPWPKLAALSLAVMLPTSLISGFLFPQLIAAANTREEHRMNTTGSVTLFNTVGSSVGALLASFILLPHLGFQGSLLLCAGFYVAAATLLSGRFSWNLRTAPGLTNICLALGLVVAFALFPYHRSDQHFANARQFHVNAGERLVTAVEGTSDTYQLLRADLGQQPLYYRLLTNGFSMSGSNYYGQRYMRLFAYLPSAMLHEPKNALLICYGVGITADALLADPRLQHIDVVDISQEVFSLASVEANAAHPNPLTNGRVQSHLQDGRFYLQATAQTYDVITAEPPPLKVAGTVNLYTEEFFRMVASRLTKSGMVTFWLPIYQANVAEIESILRAFHDVFPNMLVVGGPDEEWIMVGFNNAPAAMDETKLGGLFANDEARARFARIGIDAPSQLASLFLFDGEEVDRIANTTAPLTDFYPKRINDEPPDHDRIRAFALPYYDAHAAAERFRASRLGAALWPARLTTNIEGLFFVRETRYRSGTGETNQFAELDFYLRRTKLKAPVAEVLGSDPIRVELAESVARTAADDPPAELMNDLIAGAIARRDFKRAIELVQSAESRQLAGPNDALLLTYLYCVDGRTADAEAFAATTFPTVRDTELRDWLAKKLEADFGFHAPVGLGQ